MTWRPRALRGETLSRRPQTLRTAKACRRQRARPAATAALPLALALVLAAAPSPARAAAYLVLQVEGAPGQGFNDPSPINPAGGNPATTLGEARLRALEFAAGLWADRLDSPVPIEIAVRFEPLGGTESFATLGLGGPVDVYRDFAGTPQPATWFPAALANRLAGTDLDEGTSPDVEVVFNLDVDGPQVLGPGRFYYGLDGHPPAGDASFVQVALHEIAHGLGFTSQLDLATGAKLLGYDDVYMSWVERVGAAPPDLPSMSDGERLDALRSGPELRWFGPRLGEASAAMTAGADAQGRVDLHAPAQVTTSTLHHFATALDPDDLMEPFYAEGAWDLTLARALLADLGWGGPPGCLPNAACPEPAVLLTDNFSDGDLAGWSVVDVGANSAPSAWSVSGGQALQNRNIWGHPSGGRGGTYLVYDAGVGWTDYRLSLRLSSSDNDGIGVAFRYQDANNHYALYLHSQQSRRQLLRKVGGQETILAEDTVAYEVGDTYLVEIEAVGSQVEVSLDGRLLFSVSDDSHPAGTIGLQTDANPGSRFDDVVVVEPACAEPAVLFTDDFADGVFDGWSVVDVGTNEAPSAWSVSGGWALQSRNIWGHASGGTGGTYLVHDAGFDWSDYRVRARLRSSDNDGIGLMFRYQDSNNHYVFYLHSQQSKRLLTRRVGGQETLLASSPFAYSVNDDYVVDIIARGDQIEVHLDSVPVLSAEDAALANGTIGFLSDANAGSRFDDVRVVEEPGP